jgi:hypothetical protein
MHNGSVAIEYVVVFLLVIILLFGQSPSAISQVVDAMAALYSQMTLLLAMP